MSVNLKAMYLSASGLCLGYLMGMSVSPVVSIVLTSLVALVVGVASTLAGIEKDAKPDPITVVPARSRMELNPLPVTALVVGITFGSVVGVWSRTHDWLATSASDLKAAGKSVSIDDGSTKAHSAVLFGIASSECADLRSAPAEGLYEAIVRTVSDRDVRVVADACRTDRNCLRSLVYTICKDK